MPRMNTEPDKTRLLSCHPLHLPMPTLYVELHARSAFSFLEGACVPEELAGACASLDMPAMALLDRNGVYGSPRFHMAAKKAGVRAHIGTEITCTNGRHLSAAGRIARGLPEPLPPGHPHEAARAKGRRRGHAGRTRRILARTDLPHRASRRAPARHLRPARISTPNCSAITIARRRRATRRLSSARAASASRWWPPTARLRRPRAARTARRLHLRPQQSHAGHRRPPAGAQHRAPRQTAAEMARLFADLPEAIANTREISARLDFTLADLGYEFPRYPVPEARPDELPAQARRRGRAPPLPALSRARAASRSSANWR